MYHMIHTSIHICVYTSTQKSFIAVGFTGTQVMALLSIYSPPVSISHILLGNRLCLTATC